MAESRPRGIPGFVRLLLLADVACVAVYLMDVALGHPSSMLTGFVDLDGESNLPTWLSSGQLLVLALLLAGFAMVRIRQGSGRRFSLLALPALCLAMSLDEVAQIHEWLGKKSDVLFASGDRAGSALWHTGLWMLLLGPPFIVAVLMLWRGFADSVRGHPAVVRRFVLGFVVYAGSALGLEALSNFVVPGTLASALQVVAEELGEMLGVTLLVWAALDLLAAYRIRLDAGEPSAE